MSKNDRKALGKGLHTLLPARNAPAAVAPTAKPAEPVASLIPQDGNVSLVPIEQVQPNPDQPRREFGETALIELAQSIERDGIIQPILVRRTGSDAYQIIAGERRWRAAKLAGLKTVPVIPRTANDEQVLELAIIENIQREDLNPIDLAMAFHRMAEELGLSHEQIGEKTGKDRVTVTNTIRLLQLPDEIKGWLSERRLTPGHARALLRFEDEKQMLELGAIIIDQGLTVRQVENYAKAAAAPKPKKEPPPVDPNVKAAIGEMESRLGTRVRITEKGKDKGVIEIEYYSAEDLDRIYNIISGE